MENRLRPTVMRHTCSSPHGEPATPDGHASYFQFSTWATHPAGASGWATGSQGRSRTAGWAASGLWALPCLARVAQGRATGSVLAGANRPLGLLSLTVRVFRSSPRYGG